VKRAPAVLPSYTSTDLQTEKQTNNKPLSQHHSPKHWMFVFIRVAILLAHD
jgi:hypothetical protein